MKKLTDADIVALIREEWDTKVSNLMEKAGVKVDAKIDGEKQPVISPDLKLVHKKSGIKYTVHSVGMDDVILTNPEGEQFIVDKHELEKEYELD